MQKIHCRDELSRFRRRFTRLSHLCWIAVLLDTVYIAWYVLSFVTAPVVAIESGHLLTVVPSMLEHVLMSIFLLTAAGVAEESVIRSLR